MSGRMIDPYVEVDPDNFAHGVWTALAVTLAQPLRDALDKHLDDHCCVELYGGFAYCEEASRLFALLPDGDQIVIA